MGIALGAGLPVNQLRHSAMTGDGDHLPCVKPRTKFQTAMPTMSIRNPIISQAAGEVVVMGYGEQGEVNGGEEEHGGSIREQ